MSAFTNQHSIFRAEKIENFLPAVLVAFPSPPSRILMRGKYTGEYDHVIHLI